MRTIKLTTVALILLIGGLAGILSMARSGRGGTSVLHTSDANPARQEADGKTYAVTMSPVGTVRFAHPPTRIVTQDANYNDMLVAVGHENKLVATGYPNNVFDGFYAQIPGTSIVSLPPDVTFLSSAAGGGFDKERLYSLHADIHHIDPLQLAASRGWSFADVEEIARNVGPFFANRYSRDNAYPGKDPYEFYTLWELSDKVGQVYREEDRIAAFKAVGDKLISDIQAKLPPLEMRPRVALIYYGNGRVTPYSHSHGGFGQAQYAAIGARDVFGDGKIATYGDAGGRGTVLDIEGLLSINPDVIIMPLAIYGKQGSGQGGRAAYEQFMKLQADPLGRRLKAFQERHVYPGGTPLQGPIFFLFQIEMAAKQIYPDIFGLYRDDQQYPPDEQLFDRGRISEILTRDGGREK